MSNSLQNALETFGPSSHQYRAILGMLRECIQDIENEKARTQAQVVESDILSAAMEFLKIGD